MADFYLHELIGERRAAVVEKGRLVEMHISRDGDGLAAGARIEAKLIHKFGTRGIAEHEGQQFMLEPWPSGATEGAKTTIEVVRAAWLETGRERLAKARPSKLAPNPTPDLTRALTERGHIRKPGWPDEIAEQWAEHFDEARLGLVRFPNGSLVFEATPAFTAIDVDGDGASLVKPALLALARYIRLWGLGGGIVIDLPSSADRNERTSAAEAFDTAMGKLPFERTGINGFGLLQIVRPRPGPSILERARIDRAGTAAIEILETACAAKQTGALQLRPPANAAHWITQRPHLLKELERKTHRPIDFAVPSMANNENA